MPHTKKPERKFARYALTQQFALRCKDVKSLEQIPGAVLAINTMQKQVIDLNDSKGNEGYLSLLI